jgi:hypothetical protein
LVENKKLTYVSKTNTSRECLIKFHPLKEFFLKNSYNINKGWIIPIEKPKAINGSAQIFLVTKLSRSAVFGPMKRGTSKLAKESTLKSISAGFKRFTGLKTMFCSVPPVPRSPNFMNVGIISKSIGVAPNTKKTVLIRTALNDLAEVKKTYPSTGISKTQERCIWYIQKKLNPITKKAQRSFIIPCFILGTVSRAETKNKTAPNNMYEGFITLVEKFMVHGQKNSQPHTIHLGALVNFTQYHDSRHKDAVERIFKNM